MYVEFGGGGFRAELGLRVLALRLLISCGGRAS